MTRLGDLVVDTVTAARSVRLSQLALRVAILFAGLAALSVQSSVHGSAIVVTVLTVIACLGAMILPEGTFPTALILVLAAAWLIAVDDPAEAPVRLAVLALLLYLFHTLCALAAAMPVTAPIELRLLVPWAWHLAPVIGGTALLTVLASAMGRVPGSLALVILGLLGVIAVLGVPAWLARARR